MKACIVIVIGIAALFCGLKAARLWRGSTNVPWLPTGFEPVDLDIRRAWSNVASYEQSAKVNELNRKAAKWTAATAVVAFVGLSPGCGRLEFCARGGQAFPMIEARPTITIETTAEGLQP